MNLDGAVIDGSVIGGTTAAAGSFTTLTASGDVTFDTSTLKVDSTNNRVGIGTTSPAKTLHISAGVNDTPTTFRIENTDTSIETAQEVNAIEFYSNDASASGTGVSAKIAQVAENPGNQYSLAFSTYNTSVNGSNENY